MDELGERLAAQHAAGLHRRVRTITARRGALVTVDGHDAVDFSSNDYLALTAHPALRAAATAALNEFGAGAGAARLMSGALAPHAQLESALAAFTGRAAALLFPSGYQANIGVLSALLAPGDAAFADRSCHASISDGIRLSGAKLFRFRHNDPKQLAELLTEHRAAHRQALIVTESIFSMDGDRAPLAALAQLAQQHNTRFMVDEAHAFGMFGPQGAGLVAAGGHNAAVDILLVTFGKALGGAGAAVAGSALLIDWLTNAARGFVYSTAPPPATAAAAAAALGLLPELDGQRARVLALAGRLRDGLAARGWRTGGDTPIVPVHVGDEAGASALAGRLREAGFWVTPIRYPTVPRGAARLRLTVTAHHAPEHIDQLLAALGHADLPPA